MLNFDFLEEGLGKVSPATFNERFFKKNVFHVLLYYLTKFHSLIACTF